MSPTNKKLKVELSEKRDSSSGPSKTRSKRTFSAYRSKTPKWDGKIRKGPPNKIHSISDNEETVAAAAVTPTPPSVEVKDVVEGPAAKGSKIKASLYDKGEGMVILVPWQPGEISKEDTEKFGLTTNTGFGSGGTEVKVDENWAKYLQKLEGKTPPSD